MKALITASPVPFCLSLLIKLLNIMQFPLTNYFTSTVFPFVWAPFRFPQTETSEVAKASFSP